jgi:hypothetical protein
MNVGQLLRSLLSEAQPGEPKTLELKVGQIVKGMVLQLLSEQDALVNIGGVQVKAHLETPLKQGEVTLLQVQPESSNGQITLKPVASSTVRIADESLADVLNNMGLKDTATNRQIIQTLHQENISLSKENLQAFTKVIAVIPPNTKPEQWQQAALLAVKNNLPITMESVGALHQVIFGAPINQQLNQLSQQMNEALTNPALPKQVSESITQIKSLLTELQTISAQAFPDSTNDGAESVRAAQGSILSNASQGLPETETTLSELPKTFSVLRVTGNQVWNANSLSGAQDELLIKDNTFASITKAETSVEPAKAASLPLTGNSSLSATNETESLKTQTPQTETPQWIGKWLKSLGIEHEQQLFKTLDKIPDLNLFHKSQGSALEFSLDGSRSPNEAVKQIVTDSLKAALLQLNAMDDTPPSLKESTQQLLQQITGQQLLLSPDRTSMFSHITMMIPMNNEQGQQTAAVHIQSRKGSRGEIDANNCRLVFDLRMKSIGDTLVDVQVFNKIVSLHVHNNHDFVANLLEGSRDEIAASLQNAGYQFLSLKCSLFPEEASELTSITKEATRSPNASSYASKPYKGVDLRV